MNRPSAISVFTAATMAVLASAACRESAPGRSGRGVVERDTLGDTVVVRNTGDGVWGVPMGLRIDLSIGALEGDSTVMFGGISGMAVDAKGGIYAFDYMVPALRYFNAQGEYVRTLGHEGAGPGEYRNATHGVKVRSDGQVVMGDFRNARLNVFNDDGSPSHQWRVTTNMFGSSTFIMDHRDHMFLMFSIPGDIYTRGYQHYDANGNLIDTIPPPTVSEEPEGRRGSFVPGKIWTLSPRGAVIVGVNDRYAFEVRHLDGTMTRMERLADAVPVSAEERAEIEDIRAWQRRRQGSTFTGPGGIRGRMAVSEGPPSIPETKPFYRALTGGERGRIWVHRHVKAEKTEIVAGRDTSMGPQRTWVEPTVFDVFEPDGTYLGEVRVPDDMRLWVFRGDTVWGVREGQSEEEYLIRAVIGERTM